MFTTTFVIYHKNMWINLKSTQWIKNAQFFVLIYNQCFKVVNDL